METQFEAIYGPSGDWAVLFRKDPAYLETTLVRESTLGRRYMTLDFWTSGDAYQAFRKKFADQYKAIDARCEILTESEREIGWFTQVGQTVRGQPL